MKPDEIKIPRKWMYGLAIGIMILVAGFMVAKFDRSQTSEAGSESVYGTNLEAGSPEKFALLSGQSGERSVGST